MRAVIMVIVMFLMSICLFYVLSLLHGVSIFLMLRCDWLFCCCSWCGRSCCRIGTANVHLCLLCCCCNYKKMFYDTIAYGGYENTHDQQIGLINAFEDDLRPY